MNKKTSHTLIRALLPIFSLILLTGTAEGNTTNQIAFSQDFEDLPSGTPIIGTNGWYGPTNTLAVVTNIDYSALFSNYPLPNSTHSNVLSLQTEGDVITNEIEDFETGGKSRTTNVWFDSVVKFRHWEEDSYPPSITNNDEAQSAFFVNTNSHLVLYHYDLDATNNTFTEITNTSITNGEYARITVKLDYLTDQVFGSVEHAYYKAYVDNVPITNAAAYQTPDDTSAKTGTWFICANKGVAKKYMTGLNFAGSGVIDDLVVTTNDPLAALTLSTAVNNPAWGSLTPASQNVPEGADSSPFTASASNGYYVAQLLTNSTEVMTNSTESLITTNYTWPSVMADGTLTVNFAEATTTYMITSTVAAGTGTITPATTNVYPGRDAWFNMVAGAHSHIDGLWTNGAATGGPWDNYSTNENYAWQDVLANGTLTVSFAENMWTNDTPETWLDNFYGSTNYEEVASLDTDGDGELSWQEYLAGTDPSDSNSVFRIDDAWHDNGTNYITWVTHHVGSQTSLPPYNVERATNLVSTDWSVVTDVVQRMDGVVTNIWSWESMEGAFYRIVATNK